jgi:putative DNA primase/helicase
MSQETKWAAPDKSTAQASTSSLQSSTQQFLNAIRAAGLQPPDVIEPGKLYRFPGIGKCSGNTAGWCKLFEDGLGGVYGDWASGLSKTWRAKRCRS